MVDDEPTAQDTQSSERTPLLPYDHAETSANSKRTPLPFGQLSILLFLRFCESASTFSVSPFINEFLLSLTGGDPTKVPYYASIMDASRSGLALATIFYWSRMSDYLGRKPIILLGTAAMAASMLLLGMSKTFWMVILSRCVFGGLNANGSVIKGTVGELTDDTNRADGFALLHVPWAVGMSIGYGPLIGGSLANPHTRFPQLFSGQLWQDFPYLLPCAITALASSLGCFILLTSFRETLPRKPAASAESSPRDSLPPIRTLLTMRVFLSISSYVLLALSYLAYTAVQPLFLAMPIQIGGLSLKPTQIGYILSLYGFFNSFVQTFVLGPSVRRLGLRTTLRCSVSVFIPIFLLFPLMNIYAKDWHFYQHTNSRTIMYTLLTIQLILLSIGELGYGCTYMYINSSAPTKRSLGSVNGLGQTAVSVSRFLGPAIANGMLGVSIERGWMGGYAAYFLLSFLAVGGVVLVGLLPEGPWETKED
ncbi:MFS general substrate transporter [Macrolepiota fuliginosa MF-IS2]|uniref:MFS general substrate transporter n=1 Tax=Macrolepiota fuliginosa MF-IS2 TaxID=1400762 RepID=A0A9P5XMW0_9AGAR|nr:MFS general substrate transporter [Macrolepiota fuliginosa MF-IS2]